MITVRKVAKEEFDNNNHPILFHDKKHARCYYLLASDGVNKFKLSAQSEIEPVIKETEEIICTGVDLSVGFWNPSTESILKIITLTSFFYDFFFSEKYIFILCEVDIIILDASTLREYKEFSFSEYIESIEPHEEYIKINFSNGDRDNITI